MSSTSKDKSKGGADASPPVSASPKNGAGLGVHLAETAWRVALPFFIFSLGGIGLDRWLDTDPIFSAIGVLIALVAVSVVVYRYVEDNFPGTFSRGDKE